MIITIDGTSGSGKSAIARALAKTYNLVWLDSGAIYRILAYLVINDVDHDIKACLAKINKAKIECNLDGSIRFNKNILNEAEIRNVAISQQASKLAQSLKVREELLLVQRKFASSGGLVTDGRDMGSVIFPHANYKFFLTANLVARTKRRFSQLQSNKENVSIDALMQSMQARDERDSTRKHAPLKPAEDANIIDTSELNFNEVLAKCINIIEN